MTRKVLGCLLLFIITLSLLGGCAIFNGLTGGACYYINKARHNLPTRVSKSAPSSSAFTQKQLLTPDFENKTFNKTGSPIDFAGDVYVAVTNHGNSSYWKNGEIIDLEPSAQSKDIFVEDGNVYVAGFYYSDNTTCACYWKNGVRYDLPDGTETSAIFVKDGDVYVVGGDKPDLSSFGHYPAYWVNGVKHPIDGIEAYDIYVDENNDIYIAGDFEYKAWNFQACYWKNDVRYPKDNYLATAIFVRNSIVYVTANYGNTGVYDMSVSGCDVYTCGQYEYLIDGTQNSWGPAPCYWKNEEMIPLYNFNGNIGGGASHICVSGDDIFITGFDDHSNSILWFNGQPINLNLDRAAGGIFVVRNSN